MRLNQLIRRMVYVYKQEVPYLLNDTQKKLQSILLRYLEKGVMALIFLTYSTLELDNNNKKDNIFNQKENYIKGDIKLNKEHIKRKKKGGCSYLSQADCRAQVALLSAFILESDKLFYIRAWLNFRLVFPFRSVVGFLFR